MRVDFLAGFDFFAGVPDSQLRPLCDYLMTKYGLSKRHVIAANEGNAVALAAGYHLATGKIPVVYLQNSGIGNIVNPVASLMNNRVFGVPCVFVVGFRGEPGVPDEPQHAFQGEITLRLLEDIGIQTFVIDKATPEGEARAQLRRWQPLLESGGQVAFVIKKGALTFDGRVDYANDFALSREDIIARVAAMAGGDAVICTTGKASRELFEIRQARGEAHDGDFLTVGSMGHASSLALGVALARPEKRVWLLDGDGAALMHMGAMALLGAARPGNIVHIVINNGAHESVGGMPTASPGIDWAALASACRYPHAVCVGDAERLDAALRIARDSEELFFIEAKAAVVARENLGRPAIPPKDNKAAFMAYLRA